MAGCSYITLTLASIENVLGSILFKAGGLATYVHADFVQSYLPSGIKYRAMADAG